MTRTSLSRVLRLGLGLGVMLASFGCAKEREPIVRVQPNALDKTFFVGDLSTPTDDPEFFWRGYTTDASASQTEIGPGSWSHIDRIRWEITEDRLIARKSYALFDDPLSGAKYAGPDSQGVVVAAYRISSHFDIKRAYNPSTGEEQNLIEENTTDRPWYHRQYMRVDWSTNIVNDPMWFDMYFGQAFGNVVVSPLVYNVTDPTSEDAPHFEPADGYFDVTNRYYIEWAMTPLWGWSIPTCFLTAIFTATATYDCDPQEATVRFSFWKVDKADSDFEPLEVTKGGLDIVGNPGGIADSLWIGITTGPRQGFDPSYGFNDKDFHRLASIHNIWKQSHQNFECKAKGDADGNGTDDQCENGVTGYSGSQGSQCDVFKKKCTLPYRDRPIRTVGYWVNKLMPPEFLNPTDGSGTRGASEEIIYSWNQVLRVAAATAREVECRRTGSGDRDTCHGQFFNGQKEMVALGGWLIDQTIDETPALTMCHNPVREGDLVDVCGPIGYEARTGDIRRNMMVYWPYESRAPYGGLADWNGDPLTGEIIGGMALAMGRSVRYGAAFARDVLMVALGEYTLQDIIDGVPQGQYFSPAAQFRAEPNAQLSQKEIQSRIAAIDSKHAADTLGIKPLSGASIQDKMASFSAMKASQIYDSAAEQAAVTRFEALAAPFVGTDLESSLLTRGFVTDGLGMDPNTPTEGILSVGSPLRLMDAGKLRMLKDSVRNNLEARGACFLNEDAPFIGSINIPGLAKYFAARFPDLHGKALGEAIYNDILPETYKGIELHEVGHSLGMLHQFASSWDSPNYAPQYWQIRTNEGQANQACDPSGSGDPATCVGPRYIDGYTPDELGLADEPRPGIEFYGSTSTMEYQWERFGESAGLGPYDLFALKALYGRSLETFDDREIPVSEQVNYAPRMRTQLNEQDLVIQTTQYGTFPQPLHYTELGRRMKVFDPGRCRPATDEEKAIGKWRIVHGKVCAPPPKDHAAWQDFETKPTDPNDPSSVAVQWQAKNNGNVRWFYRFGETNNSYMASNPSDAGADPYEVAMATRFKFDAMYPFAYFRRHNREWSDFFLPSRVLQTYFDRVRSYHWHTATRSAQYMASFGPTEYAKMANDDNWLRPYLMSSVESFNLLYRSIVMPQPGTYYNAPERYIKGWQIGSIYDTIDYPSGMDVPVFDLPIGYGRFIDVDVDSGPLGGGSWNYNYWVIRSGFETEKAYAAAMLVDGRPPVYTPSRELFLDPRIQSVNFYADMPHAMDRLVAGLLAEDWETIGPQADVDGNLYLYDITNPTAPERSNSLFTLFPNTGWNQQNYAAIFWAIYSREGGDMTLMNKMRIWIDGVDGQISKTGIPDAEQQRFFNPASGFTYIARKFGPDEVGSRVVKNVLQHKIVDKGVGARMLQYANWLMAKTYQVQGGEMAPVFDQHGQVQLILDADGQPQLVASAQGDPAFSAQAALIKYVGMLDAMRQIGIYLGGGPF